MSGVAPEQIAARYPRLFHMAEAGSWPSIRDRGLLSASALLDLFEVPAADRQALEMRRRPHSVQLRHPTHGTAWLRDNQPVNETVLRRTLFGMNLERYYQALNARVFFWLDRVRLDRLRASPSYRARSHDVLVVDTAALLDRHGARVELSAINSGAVHPASTTPRGAETFLPLCEYPWLHRRGAAAELTVLHSVPDVDEMVIEVMSG